RSSALHECHPVLPNLELVPVLETSVLDPVAVHEGAVERALVLDEELPAALDQNRMVPRDRHVIEEDLAVRGTADARALTRRLEALPRPAASGTHHERRPLEPLEQVVLVLADLVGGERLRRLVRAVPLLEQRSAARTVVRGLRVQKPALAA